MDLIVLATRNDGKARELAILLHGLFDRVESLSAYPAVVLPPETGSTYRENAVAKARAAHASLGVPALGDDSGLEVDALGGAPGLHSARFAGPDATAAANNAKLLRELRNAAGERRTARFRCVLALVRAPGDVLVAEGVCEGKILEAPRGEGGFGYDPLFLPDGEAHTFAELAAERKSAISHRARAAAVLARALRSGPPTAGRACRVLLIEDNVDSSEGMALFLGTRGHVVEVAHTGTDGLDRARSSRPDVVLCDIGLEGDLDGYGVARALRAEPAFAATYLIAVTGYGREEDTRKAREAGFDLHLTKPVDPRALEALLREICARLPAIRD